MTATNRPTTRDLIADLIASGAVDNDPQMLAALREVRDEWGNIAETYRTESQPPTSTPSLMKLLREGYEGEEHMMFLLGAAGVLLAAYKDDPAEYADVKETLDKAMRWSEKLTDAIAEAERQPTAKYACGRHKPPLTFYGDGSEQAQHCPTCGRLAMRVLSDQPTVAGHYGCPRSHTTSDADDKGGKCLTCGTALVWFSDMPTVADTHDVSTASLIRELEAASNKVIAEGGSDRIADLLERTASEIKSMRGLLHDADSVLRNAPSVAEQRLGKTETLAEAIGNAVTVQNALSRAIIGVRAAGLSRHEASLAAIADRLKDEGLAEVTTNTHCYAKISPDRTTVEIGRN